MTVLILSSRGASALVRYMIKDISKFIETKEDIKYDIKENVKGILDIMDLHICNAVIYFEITKRSDCVWIGMRNGYSIKFNVFNMFTMRNLKFAVNCYKDCGHILMFTEDFDTIDYLVPVKKVFSEVFASNEVKDRALCFFWVDEKIWVRNYVIEESNLKEIGPRMVLEINKIFGECFGGEVLYSKKVEDQKVMELKEVNK